MTFSAGWKTLEHTKLGKYKSGINETWPRYVPLKHLSFTVKRGCQRMGMRKVHAENHQKNAIQLTKSPIKHYLKTVYKMISKLDLFYYHTYILLSLTLVGMWLKGGGEGG